MVGDLILFEALTGGAFDRLNWQHSGEFDQNFLKKSNARRGGGGGMGNFGIDQYINTAKQKDGLTSFLMFHVLEAKIIQYCFQEEHKLCVNSRY